jgi:hypothetical protein
VGWILERPLDLSLYYIFLLNETARNNPASFKRRNKLHNVAQFTELTICENTFWIEALESKKGEYDFNRERSSVHKITIEEVRIFF